MAKLLGLGGILLLLLSAPVLAEPTGLPTPIVDTPDLQVHVVATACNSYVLTCKKTGHYVLVDPGIGLDRVLAAQKAKGRTLKGVWITHEHGDHLTGLAALLTRHDVPVFAHGLARDAMQKRRDRQRAQPASRLSKPMPVPDHVVVDGSVLQVGKTRWKALYLPGHAPGSVGYLLEGRVLVAGDVLFKGSIGRTDLSTSDPDALARALGTKLWPLAEAVVVLPGHGPHTTLGAEKRTNRLFRDFARRGRGETPVARPWMGIQIDAAHRGPGVRLQEVVAGSPAAAAGLRARDLLLELDGVTLNTTQDLAGVIQKHAVGDRVSLIYLRAGEKRQGTLTFRAR